MLELQHISKRYQYQKVLDDVSLSFPESGLIAIVGPSGCGKSTLLHIIGGIDKDFQGDICWQNKSVKKRLNRYRKKHIGYIFQQFHLVMWLSIQQNIQLSHYFHPQNPPHQNLDIKDFHNLKISSLSLGQRQRIAYLRAYYQQSDILLCDEPTGSLDNEHAHEVMSLLKEESKQRLILYVSHDLSLVEKYSDEIYEMKDGKIDSHKRLHHIPQKKSQSQKKKKFYFSKLRISIMSLLSHKGRTFQLIFGLMLSLVCIVLTLTMSRGLESQIKQYVYSLIPESSLSFQSLNHQPIPVSFVEQLNKNESITRVHLYLDQFEFLGIGFEDKRYQESETLFIGDDTSPYQDLSLAYGHYPTTQEEIILSSSTAKRMSSTQDVSTLLDKKVYAWYKYQNQVKSITYKIVGITTQSTTVDTLYQQENAYLSLLRKPYPHIEKNATMGIVYVDKNKERSDVLKQVQGQYPQYKFIEVGVSTLNQISSTMNQIEKILIIFSLLAMISSLFLIGEVMFLNVVQKKKDLSIMKCFGATSFDLLKIVFYESLEIVVIAQCFATLFYIQLLNLANEIVKEVLLNETMVFSIDYELLGMVYLFSFLLVFISQLIPLTYVFKLNTIKALKQ